MTTYMNQTIAKQQVAELIADAERARVRREIRRARRDGRAEARSTSGPGTGGASSSRVRWNLFGLVAAR